MNSKIKAAIYLGLLCSLWTFIMEITGWFKDPILLNLFYVVIIIEIGVLVWGLKQTAKDGKTYGGQIVIGLTVSVICGIIIFVFSYLFTTIIFPSHFQELQTMYKGFLV
jgi:TM2 domain-containing membrane protein YozV